MSTYKVVRFISKPCKVCKTVTSIAARKTASAEFPVIDPPAHMGNGNWWRGGHAMAYQEEGTDIRYPANNGLLIIHCRGCGALVGGNRVRGSFDPSVVCNAKCQAAKGLDCQCSCAGKNHGASYDATEHD